MTYQVWSQKSTGCELETESLEWAMREGLRIATETKKEVLIEAFVSEYDRKPIAVIKGKNIPQ